MNPAKSRPELVIALVCPLGVPIDKLEGSIKKSLDAFDYKPESITLSELLTNLDFWRPEKDGQQKTRIKHRQEMAFAFRKAGEPDALARAAIGEIRRRRQLRTGHPDKTADGIAYILRQLKRPEEVQLLRRVYGPSFHLVAGHAPVEVRTEALSEVLAPPGKSAQAFVSEAAMLINIDDKEDSPADQDAKFGQNTRDAFPLADCFVNLSTGEGESVQRFIELLFGHPSHTPTAEEIAMHQANAMSLRSSDERRQVGAVIVKRTTRGEGSRITDATVVASGMNEVPRRQGGYYWGDDSPDGRDQAIRDRGPIMDREEKIKLEMISEVADRLKAQKWLRENLEELDASDLAHRLQVVLAGTQLTSITEFMRQVHAEMAAIVDAAMRGVAIRACEMYVTTFPCHGCAKHIIAAGIAKVVYLEPYAKSRAESLHREEIALYPKDTGGATDRVVFTPFTGVAPGQFARLFSMTTRGRKNARSLSDWRQSQESLPPIHIPPNHGLAYVRTEREELEYLPTEYVWDRATLAPPES